MNARRAESRAYLHGGFMRKNRLWIPLGFCAAAVATALIAQSNRNPGLWQVTVTVEHVVTPFPVSPFNPPQTRQECVTPEMISRYGGPMPQMRDVQGGCQFKYILRHADWTTTEYACTGNMIGTGKIESKWSANGTSTGTLHFKGKVLGRPTVDIVTYKSVFKGADCGSAKPLPMPPG